MAKTTKTPAEKAREVLGTLGGRINIPVVESTAGVKALLTEVGGRGERTLDVIAGEINERLGVLEEQKRQTLETQRGIGKLYEEAFVKAKEEGKDWSKWVVQHTKLTTMQVGNYRRLAAADWDKIKDCGHMTQALKVIKRAAKDAEVAKEAERKGVIFGRPQPAAPVSQEPAAKPAAKEEPPAKEEPEEPVITEGMVIEGLNVLMDMHDITVEPVKLLALVRDLGVSDETIARWGQAGDEE